MNKFPTNSATIQAFITGNAHGITDVANRSKSLYSSRGVLFSYGEHFPLARIVASSENGKPVMLVNNNGTTPTTSKQRSLLVNIAARNHVEVIMLDCPTCEGLYNFIELVHELIECREVWKRSRKYKLECQERYRSRCRDLILYTYTLKFTNLDLYRFLVRELYIVGGTLSRFVRGTDSLSIASDLQQKEVIAAACEQMRQRYKIAAASGFLEFHAI